MSDPIKAALLGPVARAAVAHMRQHRNACGYDRTALRCAYGDAAHLLDAIRADSRPPKPLRGEAARQAEAVARALKHAADAIWELREEANGERAAGEGGE